MMYIYSYQSIAFTVEGGRDKILRLFTSQFTYVLQTCYVGEKREIIQGSDFMSCLMDYLFLQQILYYTKCVALNLNNVKYSLSEYFCVYFFSHKIALHIQFCGKRKITLNL